MKLKTGQSLASVTDTTTVIVIKAGTDDVSLTCGGAAMTDPKSVTERLPIADGAGGVTELGKRYVDEAESIELLCTKGGEALLALNGSQLSVKAAKPLPASD